MTLNVAAGAEGRLSSGRASPSQRKLDHLWSFLWPLRGKVFGRSLPPNTSRLLQLCPGELARSTRAGLVEGGGSRRPGGGCGLGAACKRDSVSSGVFGCWCPFQMNENHRKTLHLSRLPAATGIFFSWTLTYFLIHSHNHELFHEIIIVKLHVYVYVCISIYVFTIIISYICKFILSSVKNFFAIIIANF